MEKYTQLIPAVVDLYQRYGQEPPLTGLKITFATEPMGLIRTVYQPSLCVVLQGAKKTVLGEQVYQYRAGECLFASADLPVTAHILKASSAQPYIAISVAMQPELVRELLLYKHSLNSSVESLSQSSTSTGSSSPALITAQVPQEIIDPLQRLLALVGKKEDQQVLAPLAERELIWRLLGSNLKTALAQLGVADSYNSRINGVTKYLRQHYSKPISVAEMAAMANMSVPSFHRHFKAVTQMSPVQFQKQIRLHEARRQLLVERDISAIGYSVGYESPSQFSRDYRKYFGLSPQQDREELKGALINRGYSELP